MRRRLLYAKKDDLWMGFLVIAGIPLLLILEYPFVLLIILIAIALIIVLALLIKNSEGPRRLKKQTSYQRQQANQKLK